MADRLIASVELSMPRTFPKDCVLCEPLADERCSWLQWHCWGCVLGIPVQMQTRPRMKESKQPGNTHKVSVNGTGQGRMWRNSTMREEKWAFNGKIEEMAQRGVRIWWDWFISPHTDQLSTPYSEINTMLTPPLYLSTTVTLCGDMSFLHMGWE